MNPFHWPEFLFGCAVGGGATLATICAVCVYAYRKSENVKAEMLAKAAGSLGSAVRDAAQRADTPANN